MSPQYHNNNDQFMNDDRFDGLYMNVASATKGIEPLLDTVFSFLRRKTDFFSGGIKDGSNNPEEACKIAVDKVHEIVKKHTEVYLKQQQQQQHQQKKKSTPKGVSSTIQNNTSIKSSSTTSTTTKDTSIPTMNKKTIADDVIEMNTDGGFDLSSQSQTTTSDDGTKTLQSSTTPTTTTTTEASAVTTESPTKTTTSPTPMIVDDEKPITTGANDGNDDNHDDTDGDKASSKRGPPPVGNGGVVDGKYSWTQTLSELVVTVPVPENTRGKDLNVTITKTHLKVQLRTTGTIIMDDPLTKSIICDDSFWTVEDMNRLVLTLQKINTMEWWDSVCVGHTKINIQDIQPENSSLSDLDGDTRKTVEKMMFDQRQRALGKPTADEQGKLDMLEKFKLQHPELDFSNAKIT